MKGLLKYKAYEVIEVWVVAILYVIATFLFLVLVEPLEELANGGYEELSDSERHGKVRKDYIAFIQKRGALFEAAAKKLCKGHPITANEIVEHVAI